MTTHHASEGVIKVGTNVIAEIRGFRVNEAFEAPEDTILSDTSKTYSTTGMKSWTASMTAFWDETDTNGQMALTIGASVTIKVCPEGYGSGDRYGSGQVEVVSLGVANNTNGMVEMEIEVRGNGPLTWTTV